MPVDNNEHQRIDDVSTDRIPYDIRFRFVTHELFDCCVKASQLPPLSMITCRYKQHDLAMF